MVPSCLQESKIKASRMHIYVRRGGPNYQTGLAKMRALGAELGVPLEVSNYSLQSMIFHIFLHITATQCK